METAEIFAWLIAFVLFVLSALVCTVSFARPQSPVIPARSVTPRRDPVIATESVRPSEEVPAVVA